MADLRCTETVGTSPRVYGQSGYSTTQSGYSQPIVCRAYRDPVILEDSRVFQNMLDIEEFYVAATNYFQNTQSEIKPHMRKIVTDWMLEVCLDQNCHADVFLLACNVMDRFLSQINIRKNQFQLVAASTIFISSKLVDPCPLSSQDLIKYTDNTYTITELLEMELLILSKLKWDLSAITPYDFLEYLLRLLAEGSNIDSAQLRRHTENFIILCATEFRFSMYPPSMLSSAALAAAAGSLGAAADSVEAPHGSMAAYKQQQLHSDQLVKQLQILTRVENDCLKSCIRQIEETFKTATANVNNTLQSQQLKTTSNNSPAKVNNNNKQSKELDNKQSKELDNSEERKSQTPTEVFSVDWLYVA